MLSKKAISRIQKDSAFSEFKEFVLAEIKKIDSTEGLGNLPNAQAGEEAKIRAKTVSRLMSILNPILNFKEKEAPSVEMIAKAKRDKGL